MNKKYISLIIISLIAVGVLPTILGIEENTNSGCYQERLIQSDSRTLLRGDGPIKYKFPAIPKDCNYTLKVYGITECDDCNVDWVIAIGFKNLQNLPEEIESILEEELSENNEIVMHVRQCGVFGPESLEFPGWVVMYIDYIRIENNGSCPIQYSWELYSLCPCKSNVALYPKVDIEQFSVTGGSTIIKDGKIISAFNVAPGVQQTMIQVENRGFFTQKDARVRFIGLPEGVTVELTPATQTIKAHNIGTYSATFTVGSNVPSGTYDIAMVAFSPSGIFDTIRIQLVVP